MWGRGCVVHVTYMTFLRKLLDVFSLHACLKVLIVVAQSLGCLRHNTVCREWMKLQLCPWGKDRTKRAQTLSERLPMVPNSPLIPIRKKYMFQIATSAVPGAGRALRAISADIGEGALASWQVNLVHGSEFQWIDFLSPFTAQLYRMNQLGFKQMYKSGTGFLENKYVWQQVRGQSG